MTIPIDSSGSRHAESIPWTLWLSIPVILAGFGALEWHSLSASTAARPPSRIAVSGERVELLVFLHPQCPCSRATLTELERIAGRTDGIASMRAYVLADDAIDEPASESDAWRRVARIPGFTVHADRNGERAREFGVDTSGTVLLYGRDGRLLFDGGITASRGHEGENGSTLALLERITSGTGRPVTTPAFGCALRSGAREDVP